MKIVRFVVVLLAALAMPQASRAQELLEDACVYAATHEERDQCEAENDVTPLTVAQYDETGTVYLGDIQVTGRNIWFAAWLWTYCVAKIGVVECAAGTISIIAMGAAFVLVIA